ncbi:MAG: hypothetical protein WCL51_15615 [Bacteroidota bacterium]
MDFNNLEQIKQEGFLGFKSLEDLIQSTDEIPKVRGIYFIIFLNEDKPNFLEIGADGFFKGKDPNVTIEKLNQKWVNKTKVIYIGKAGGEDSKATLKSRLNQYLKFGQGKNIGHYGGRLIWQIENHKELLICWKPLPNDSPRSIEYNLIQDFISNFGKRPFANLTD